MSVGERKKEGAGERGNRDLNVPVGQRLYCGLRHIHLYCTGGQRMYCTIGQRIHLYSDVDSENRD